MHINSIILFAYGTTLIIGGYIGYKKSQSSVSLYSGVGFGLLFLFTAMGVNVGMQWSQTIALCASGFLSVFFSYRYYKSQRFMPTGMLALLSIAVSCILLGVTDPVLISNSVGK